MTRLYVVAEGLTEVSFVREVLQPFLEQRCPGRMTVAAPNLRGQRRYSKVRKEVQSLLGAREADVRVTTMIDLYRLPTDFPGLAEADHYDDPHQRVEQLEARFGADVQDARFVPYLQLHEFEALILADLAYLARYYPHREKALQRLAEKLDRSSKPS